MAIRSSFQRHKENADSHVGAAPLLGMTVDFANAARLFQYVIFIRSQNGIMRRGGA